MGSDFYLTLYLYCPYWKRKGTYMAEENPVKKLINKCVENFDINAILETK